MAHVEPRLVTNHCGDMVPGGERLPDDMTADAPGRSEDRQLDLIFARRGLPGCLRGCGCVAFCAKSCLHFGSPSHTSLCLVRCRPATSGCCLRAAPRGMS
jgi:hypothetical protein